MFRRILVVMENEAVCRQAVDHARELAARMSAEVGLLMLVEMGFAGDTRLGAQRRAISRLGERVGALLTQLSGEFLRQGVSTTVALRLGEPAEEMLKFLAERPPFQVVIWGSGETLSDQAHRDHWLVRAAGRLECPLWTVRSRGHGAGGAARA